MAVPQRKGTVLALAVNQEWGSTGGEQGEAHSRQKGQQVRRPRGEAKHTDFSR